MIPFPDRHYQDIILWNLRNCVMNVPLTILLPNQWHFKVMGSTFMRSTSLTLCNPMGDTIGRKIVPLVDPTAWMSRTQAVDHLWALYGARHYLELDDSEKFCYSPLDNRIRYDMIKVSKAKRKRDSQMTITTSPLEITAVAGSLFHVKRPDARTSLFALDLSMFQLQKLGKPMLNDPIETLRVGHASLTVTLYTGGVNALLSLAGGGMTTTHELTTAEGLQLRLALLQNLRCTHVLGYCHCGNSHDGDFHVDGTACNCGMEKEHQHCTNCHGYTQIG